MNVLLAVLMLQAAAPQAPVLGFGESAASRFEFAPIPEVALVAGIPETVQLGPFQLDPVNRWTPGDFTRASGWRAQRLTRLVDHATGLPVPGAPYNGETGEIGYTGAWSGDATVRLETEDRAVQSAPFRIRALAPSVVWGFDAQAIATQRQWSNAVVCEYPAVSFAGCRAKWKGGATDGAPLVLFITPGTYPAGQDYYVGVKRFAYILGDPTNRPLVVGDQFANGKFEIWQLRNLIQERGRITAGEFLATAPGRLIVWNVRQCCETKDNNGIVNPNKTTPQPQTIALVGFESVGMGSTGNGQHAIYVEGRPLSTLEINNSRFLGSRASSSVKTTMQNVAIRHTLFCTSQSCAPPVNDEVVTAVPVDIPAVCNITIYGNEFRSWRQSTTGNPTASWGNIHAVVFIRLRQQGMKGSDKPAYPNVSWSPPKSTSTAASSPGKAWPKGPETFVADAFWQDVAAMPITDPANALSFKHYIGFNHLVQQSGSLPLTFLRDDGTLATEATVQFGPDRKLPTHVLWIERSVDFLYGNTTENVPPGQPLIKLKDYQYVAEVVEPTCQSMTVPTSPCTKWPREGEAEFPHAVELTGPLPPWFKL